MCSISLHRTERNVWDTVVSLHVLAMTEYQTGDFAEADRYLDRIADATCQKSPCSPLLLPQIVRITGNMQDMLGDTEAVLRQIPENPDLPYSWAQIRRRKQLSLIAVLRGDESESARCLELLLPYAGCYCSFGFEPSVNGILGLLCSTLRRFDEAAEHFEKALAFCRRTWLRPELAWTCLDYAEALLHRDGPGDQEHARNLLDEGRALARDLGMRPLLGRMEPYLERHVVALSSGAASARYGRAAPPSGLTRREVQVLRLVARGFTNQEVAERLFISTHTATRHVHNMLEKTGMANRTELALFASRQGLLE